MRLFYESEFRFLGRLCVALCLDRIFILLGILDVLDFELG